MIYSLRLFVFTVLFWTISGGPTIAADDPLCPQINVFASADIQTLSKQVEGVAATGDARVLPVLKALAEGRLYYRKSDRLVVFADKDRRRLVLTDPLTDEELGTVKKRKV